MEMNYRKVELYYGCNIETAVAILLKHKENGELVSADFNGHMLYSDNVTLDSAYLEITGKTKAEWDKEREQARTRKIREDEEHKAMIPELSKEWIDKGHKILDEKYWSEWDKCVPIRLGNLYRGMELKSCLDIIEPLNNGCSLDAAKEIIDNQDHSGMSFCLVREMVKAFCDRGQEFAEFVS